MFSLRPIIHRSLRAHIESLNLDYLVSSKLVPRRYAQRDSTSDPSSKRFVGMSGGQIFHELMKDNSVKTVFGYPGGAILPVFDAIYGSDQFKFILSRHEQGAGHMAQGYARVTGKPGVVIVTSGPGATNMVTPMQDALADGTPLVVFSGQVATHLIGTDAFQEAPVVDITKACTKWNVQVKDIKDLPWCINEAFRVATSGRPGPVLVDLPKDITAGIFKADSDPYNTTTNIQQNSTPKYTEDDIKKVAHLINIAKKPVIYAGQGVISSGSEDLVTQLAHKAQIPVTTTLQGLGAFDENHYLSLHMLGMHGSAYANYAMQNADLIIAIGTRFDDRVTGKVSEFAPAARKAEKEGRGGIIQFEIYPRNINKIVNVTHAIQGDCLESLKALLPHVNKVDTSADHLRTDWIKQIKQWKATYPFAYIKSSKGEKMKPQTVLEELNRQCEKIGKDKVILSTGVGQHQMWAAQFYRWTTARSMITSGGHGTMGFGLPSAIGAKLAAPDKIVIDIDGDGSFLMTGIELVTAAQYNIGVKILLLNNEFQGMVKQWQELFYECRYSGTAMHNPDFIKLAKSCRIKAMRVTSEKGLASAMKKFLEYPGPILMEAVVTNKEHVLPMVSAGKALHEMVLFGEHNTTVDKDALPPS